MPAATAITNLQAVGHLALSDRSRVLIAEFDLADVPARSIHFSRDDRRSHAAAASRSAGAAYSHQSSCTAGGRGVEVHVHTLGVSLPDLLRQMVAPNETIAIV